MERNNRVKLLFPVLGCCGLLMGSQIIADLIFTAIIIAGMDISGIPAAEVDAMVYERLTEYGNEIMLLSYAFTFVGLLIWAKLAKTPFMTHTGLNLKTTKPIGILSVLAGIAGNFWFSMMVGFFPWPEKWVEEYDAASSAITSGNLMVELLAVVLFAPLIEEILFRGMAYRYLAMALPAGAAIVFQGMLFGGMHGTMIWIVYASILGCIFGYVRRRTGSLHATILMHIGFNGGSYLFMAFAERWGESGGAILGGFLASAALFLLMLYGIEYRIGEAEA